MKTEKKKLTICFFAPAASIHSLKWAKFFAENNHIVHLFSFEPVLENYDLGNIYFHLLKKIPFLDSWIFNIKLTSPLKKYIKEIIKEIKPDIIHCHYLTSYGSLGMLSGFHPLILTAWGSDILITPRKKIHSKLSVKYYLQKANLITCDAEHMKKEMIKLGANEARIKIINFGIDTEKFKSEIINNNLKKEIGVTNEKIIISLRGLDPIYDIKTLIKAAKLVTKEYTGVKFVIGGTGPQEKELKDLVENFDISDKIIFTGFIDNKNVSSFLNISDIYISTSLSDAGISASTAEAMACELPVIITDNAENREWVKNNEGGFFIKPGDVEVLSKKILYLLRNDEIRRNFGKENRKVIIQKNDYNNEMEKMEKIYYQLININN